jgi:hypothetical protein
MLIFSRFTPLHLSEEGTESHFAIQWILSLSTYFVLSEEMVTLFPLSASLLSRTLANSTLSFLSLHVRFSPTSTLSPLHIHRLPLPLFAGTFHECVNGLLKRKDGMGGTVPIAMIAGGTGNSFSLELLGDTDVKLAVDTIIRGIHAPVDVGKIAQLDVKDNGQLGNEVCREG